MGCIVFISVSVLTSGLSCHIMLTINFVTPTLVLEDSVD